MNRLLLCCLLAALAGPESARAAAEVLLVPPAAGARAGKLLELTVYLNNPTTEPFTLVVPDVLHADIASATEQRRVNAVAAGRETGERRVVAPMNFATLKVALVLPDTLEGTVSLRLPDLGTNAVMFAVEPALAVKATPLARQAAEEAVASRGEDLDLDTDREMIRRHISRFEPIYFAVGAHGGTNARFQFSFKYLLVAANNNDPAWYNSVYLGYTQTSLWDLASNSKPFYDSSYKPTLFFLRESLKWHPSWLSQLGLIAGVQHESNGKGGPDSRSLNTAYAAPVAVWTFARDWRLVVAPRVVAYLEKQENPDIARYRGNVDWYLRLGTDKGVQFAALLRKGNGGGYGSGQLDVTVPLRSLPAFSPNAGGYLQFQYFNGWGESLLDYNRRRPDQFRLGYTIVR
ncbi:MAG: phospholipase A [Verrucomicrobia bacterium]|nr:phospholipase A [Verrucomicrobiota bacterium]